MRTSSEINDFSGNSQELTSKAVSFAKSALTLGKITLRDLQSISGSTISAIQSSSDDVSKWTNTMSNGFSMLTNGFGSISKGPTKDAIAAVQIILKVADTLVGSVFKHVDDVMKLQASVTDIGITATKTTSQLVGMAKNAGFPVNRAATLMESFNSVGTSLTFLGPNTGKAAERLSKVFDNREDQLKYLKQGLDPSNLIKYQAEGVKFLTGFGVKASEDDIKVRKTTLAYVDSLTTLSLLTGESRDQMAAILAVLKSDTSYQIKMRELQKSGNTKAFNEFNSVMVLLDGVSPELKKGMADFIANGSATTVEAKKMMLVMGSKGAELAKAIEEGTMTGAEAAKEVGIAYQRFMKTNQRALSLSTDFQNASGANGKVFMETERLSTIKSEADAKKIIDENAKKPDAAIEAKNSMLNAEREINFVGDEVKRKMMPNALLVFFHLMKMINRTTFTIAQFTLGINGGKYDKNIEEIMMLVGDTDDVKEMQKRAKERVDEVDANIERLKNPQKRKAELAAKSKLAEADFNRLSDSHASPQQIEAARKRMIDAKREERQDIIKQRELKEKGFTVEQLQGQRYDLIQRQEKINSQYSAMSTAHSSVEWSKIYEEKAESKQKLHENIMNVDLGDAAKYIKFNSGSGSEQNWAVFSSRNPGLAKNVTLLAEEYFKQTNQKLSLTSSFRSYEEQKALYDGWLKAGGGPGKPMVYVPGHGNVNTPANPDNRETPHMGSTAVDISKDQLDWLEGRGILQRAGLRRPYRNDPVHIEKAKFGKSLIQGKEIEMHGREALIELFNGTIPITLPPDFKENTFSEIKDTIKPKVNTQSTTTKPNNDNKDVLDLELLSAIDSQFDDLIASMDKSNLLQHDIKTYMAA